ncbi:hypothetical protein BTEBP_20108 [Brochothrix thermosphacta]|nr:hypothetical protein BTEBP_20108 [Brochothrix thermosphacta]
MKITIEDIHSNNIKIALFNVKDKISTIKNKIFIVTLRNLNLAL